MDPSSLIFFVIFAVWAAYMLKHWVRRRENLATARTVDRFSEAMRMLERRTPVRADVTTRDEAPQRTILRPQVSVKGATPAGGSSAAPGADASVEKTARPGGLSGVRAASRMRGRVTRPMSPLVKLGALFGSVAFFLVTAVLAPFTAVPFWVPLLGLVAVVGVVAWLRRSAIAARQARSVAPVRRATAPTADPARPVRRAHAHGASVVGDVAPTPERRPVAPSSTASAAPVDARHERGREAGAARRSPLVAAPEPQVEVEVEVEVEGASEEAVFDQEPSVDAAARAEAELFDNAAWAPVDVPRPTYTMKAKADRDEVAPASTVDEADARPLAARYENTPVDELPFDGMALDEDYDELPQVFRAG